MLTDKESKKIYNGIAWKNKRLEILKRDKFECQDCIERLKAANQQGILLNA